MPLPGVQDAHPYTSSQTGSPPIQCVSFNTSALARDHFAASARSSQFVSLSKDGVMYMTGSYSRVFAVDARTGKKLWQYDARLPDDIRPCCDVINSGVALYGDLVFFGTLDAKLVRMLDLQTHSFSAATGYKPDEIASIEMRKADNTRLLVYQSA